LGDILKLRSERTRPVATLLSVTAERGVIPQSESGRRDSSSEDKSLYLDVHPGDIVYNTMRMWQGVSGVAEKGGIVSPAYTVCRPTEDVHSRFLGYLLKEPRLVAKFLNRSQGLVSDTWNLRYSDFKKIDINLPPLAEQRRIAEILDEVDVQIKALHAQMEKLRVAGHALLEAALSDALRPLRETEVSRLERRIGEEVGAFQIVTVGDLVESIEAGNSPDLEGSPAGEGQWGVLKVSAVGREGFRPRENKRVDDPALIDTSIEVRPGDLLMTRANTPELVGMACVVERVRPGLMLSDKTLRLVMREVGDPGVLVMLLRQPEMRKQIEIAATGTSNSMKNISQESIRNLVVPWPSKTLQSDVLAKSAGVREESSRWHAEISKLGLLKKRLLTDLLTGDTRVRV